MLLTIAIHPINTVHPIDTIHPTNAVHPTNTVHPTGAKHPIHMLRWWDFPHSEAINHFSLMRFSPLKVSPLLMEILPLGGLGLYTPLMWFFSSESVKADMPTSTLSAIVRESKPSVMGFLQLRVPHSIVGISHSQSPRLIFYWWDFLTRSTSTSLRALLIWTYRQMNPNSFPLSGSFHPYSDAGDTTLLGSYHPYSDDGIFPTRKTTLLWNPPTRRPTSLFDLLPLGVTGSSL